MKLGKILALALALILLMPAAHAQQVAMGRYVQEKVALPQQMGIYTMMEDSSGRLALLASDGSSLALAALNEQGGWDMSALHWIDQLANYGGWGAVSNIALAGDQVYLNMYVQSEEGFFYQVLRGQGDRLTPMDMGAVGADLPYITGIAADASGIVALESHLGGAYGYDFATGQRVATYDRVGGELYAEEGKLYAVARQEQSLLVYDMRTGELLSEMAGAPFKESNALYAQGDSVYLINAGGVYRITLGGSMWERLVDGELTDLRLPSTYPTALFVTGDLIYALAQQGGQSKLLRFAYDPNVTTLPTKTLSVYTLRASRILEQAASVFQAGNPDYLVDVTVLLGEDTGATRQDVISALNVEILAGKGPDVLVLDGLPTASYIEKGVLYDLSGVVKPMMEQGQLMDNLFTPLFTQEGALYQAPSRASVPVLMTNARIDSWQALVDGVRGGMKLPARSLMGYTQLFLAGNFPSFFGPDGVDEAALKEYLSGVLAIYQACGKPGAGDDRQVNYAKMLGSGLISENAMSGYQAQIDELIKLGDGRLDAVPCMVEGLSHSMMELSQAQQMNIDFDFLPGAKGNVYVPINLLGVNAQSAQLDAALNFVAAMLGRQVQDADLYDAGMPVNRLSFAATVDREESELAMSGSFVDEETGETLMVGAQWPGRPIREKAMALLGRADTPYLADETLLNLIDDALSGFYQGENDVDQAVDQVKARLRAYLAE